MTISSLRNLLVPIGLYALCLISAFFFFRSYIHTLTTEVLLTGNQLTILRGILHPVLLLASTMYLLTLAIKLKRWPYILPLLSIVFLLGHRLDKTAILSSALILFAFSLYYVSFFKSLSLLKRPSVYPAALMSIGLVMTILSAAMTLNVYNSYYANVIKTSSKLSQQMTRYLAYTLTTFNLESQSVRASDTLESYSTRIIQGRGQVETPALVSAEEASLSTKMGLIAKPSDRMSTLLNSYAAKRIDVIIRLYQKQLGILIPLGFFLITQVLFSAASSLATVALLVTEFIYTRIRIRI